MSHRYANYPSLIRLYSSLYINNSALLLKPPDNSSSWFLFVLTEESYTGHTLGQATMFWHILAGILLTSSVVQGKLHIYKRGRDIELVEEYEFDPRTGESECKCRCRKLNSNQGWECCKCAWTNEVCFPGDAHVQLESGESIPMSNLSLGQKVLSVKDDGTPGYSEVLTFLKRHPRRDAVYLTIKTETDTIRMTPRHIVFMSATNNSATRQPRFAHEVMAGDYLFSVSPTDITSALVLEISHQIMEGVYVPLTESGTLVVDGILASCYSSINHHLAHVFLAPVRWYPSLFRFHGEDYGMPNYVTFIKWLAHQILPSNYQGHYGKNKIHVGDPAFPVSQTIISEL